MLFDQSRFITRGEVGRILRILASAVGDIAEVFEIPCDPPLMAKQTGGYPPSVIESPIIIPSSGHRAESALPKERVDAILETLAYHGWDGDPEKVKATPELLRQVRCNTCHACRYATGGTPYLTCPVCKRQVIDDESPSIRRMKEPPRVLPWYELGWAEPTTPLSEQPAYREAVRRAR